MAAVSKLGEWVERPDGMWALRITRPLDQEKVAEMREMLGVQGSNGNWNYDSYMHGLYNGMEYMQAMVEDREPDFRAPPEKWLSDRQRKVDLVVGAGI